MTKFMKAVKSFFLGKGRVALQEKVERGDMVLTIEVSREARTPTEEIRKLLGAKSLASFWEHDLLEVSVCAETQKIILDAPFVVRVKRGSVVRVYAKRS